MITMKAIADRNILLSSIFIRDEPWKCIISLINLKEVPRLGEKKKIRDAP
jgi:hypothetical protein